MSRPTKAVIVAAGRSSRLYPLTIETPKGLIEVGGCSLLDRSIGRLREAGVREIALVVGFEYRKIVAALAHHELEFIYNPFYSKCNNLGSLWFSRCWVGCEAFAYLHSDIIYAPEILSGFLDRSGQAEASLCVDKGPVDAEAMKVSSSSDDRLIESSKDIPPDRAAGEWIGLARFSRAVVPSLFATLEEVLAEGMLDAYDTEAFTRMARRGFAFEIVSTQGAPWVEIDCLDDLRRARLLFEPPGRSGG